MTAYHFQSFLSPSRSDLSGFGNPDRKPDQSGLRRGGMFAGRSEGEQGGGKQRRPTRPLADARSHALRQGEGEVNPALCKAQRDTSLRRIGDALCIPRFCDRAACRRMKKCSGDPERCLTLFSPEVPLDARKFVIDLLNSRDFGYSFEEALRRDKDTAQAFFAWQSANQPAVPRSAPGLKKSRSSAAPLRQRSSNPAAPAGPARKRSNSARVIS